MGSGRGSEVQKPGAQGTCTPHGVSTPCGPRNIPDPLSEERLHPHPGPEMNANRLALRAKKAEIGTAQRSETTRRIG
jgi:hypothetical protein